MAMRRSMVRVLSINNVAHVPIADKRGMMTNEFRILLQQLLDNVCDQLHPTNGVGVPQQKTNIITQIDATKNNARILYDSDIHRHVGFENGVLKKFVME